jgi:hypothetical protein
MFTQHFSSIWSISYYWMTILCFSLLSNVGVVLALVGTIFGAVCQGFIESFLEEYLAIFGLSVAQIGVSFLGMYVQHLPPFISPILVKWPSSTRRSKSNK